MPRKFAFALLVLLASGSSALAGGVMAAPSSAIQWHTSYNKGLALAKQTGKPVLIDFWADWCPPCKAMDREVWNQEKVITLSEKFVCVSVDTDKDSAAAGRFYVKALPTIVLADSWGNAIIRHEGYLPASSLTKMMESFPANFSEINEWNGILERDDKNTIALTRIGDFYRRLGALDLSNRYLKKALQTPGAKSDASLRETLLITIGLNHFRMGQFKDAQKTFQQCLKEVPDGTQCDKALLGIVTSQINQKKIADAEKTYEQLKTKYPDSAATQQAARNLQEVRGRQP